MPDLIRHIKGLANIEDTTPPPSAVPPFAEAKGNPQLDYGLIFVAEGCRVRGRSGAVADIIVRDLTAAGISARAEFPEHLQRSGDTAASDRILACQYANAALNAIENSETFVMTAKQNGIVKTIAMSDVIDAGVIIPDPNVPNMFVSNEYVSPDDPLIRAAIESGVFI
jgi:6-phosphofructokinase